MVIYLQFASKSILLAEKEKNFSNLALFLGQLLPDPWPIQNLKAGIPHTVTCSCGHTNPFGSVWCEKCEELLTARLLDSDLETTARRLQPIREEETRRGS